MEYTYLLVNFFTIIIPFLFSFHPKLNFYKTWPAFFPAVLLTGLLFVLWDMQFTSIGVWGFNERYLTGIELGNLPIEEVFFFICIPYACVFTFHCLSLFMTNSGDLKMQRSVTIFLIVFSLATGFLNLGKLYTSTTFFLLAVLLIISEFIYKANWLLLFYKIYLVLLLPFFIVNGILTGSWIEEEVVWYNSEEYMGIRLGTIPLEDVFYGATLILMNLLIYKFLFSRKSVNSGAPSAEITQQTRK